MAIVMRVFQAGGQSGSTAGDCAAITTAGWCAGIDLGRGNMPGRVQQYLEAHAVAERHLVITHFHGDHGDPNPRAQGDMMRWFRGAGAGHLQRFPTSGGNGPNALLDAIDDDWPLVRVHNRNVADAITRVAGADRIAHTANSGLYTLTPTAAVGGDENRFSGGVYAESRTAAGPQFGFLSLGDMDPDTSTNVLNALLHGALAAPPPTLLIKLPHHGSSENRSAAIRGIIGHAHGQGSRVWVMSSGHTGRVDNGADGVTDALDANAVGAFILVENVRDVRRTIGSGLVNQYWRRRAGVVRPIGDAEITIDDAGAITLTARTWRYDERNLQAVDGAACVVRLDQALVGALPGGNPYAGRTVSIDPAHGGALPAGTSTPYGHRGRAGLAEKTLVLDICRRAVAIAHTPVALTRTDDTNPTIRERIGRSEGADAFVTVHLDGPPAVFVHDEASPETVAAADRVATALHVGVYRARLAALDPRAHAPGRVALYVSLGDLESDEAERAFASERGQRQLAARLAEIVDRV